MSRNDTALHANPPPHPVIRGSQERSPSYEPCAGCQWPPSNSRPQVQPGYDTAPQYVAWPPTHGSIAQQPMYAQPMYGLDTTYSNSGTISPTSTNFPITQTASASYARMSEPYGQFSPEVTVPVVPSQRDLDPLAYTTHDGNGSPFNHQVPNVTSSGATDDRRQESAVEAVELHTGRWACPKCYPTRTYARHTECHRHIRDHHLNLPRHECPYCGKTFPPARKEQLSRHVLKDHPEWAASWVV
ncbi:hypothetical protein PUNSTDRAFT_51783 [Punctularia strigosozonata HHB-11173 SS5]|uniref:uncharacterized protein n=1 Tax=Punctularia strigosozonata (strain HHB-11173) TaxID=741275 RepID=UPI0004418636|nr:uncharacterized protein PUNSTDRAFT_51783 [Punctularia strigosozonata HHB-11173 SS5]EIN09544.1 hypothetical protein PUNSTDRAFT_51783 [Punctularia strigosozonata HHB-11173 SS5]